MLQCNAFRFRQDILPLKETFDGGYFSFLPLLYHYRLSEKLHATLIELEECVVLELKGSTDTSGLRIDLVTEEIGFWQLYQFLNTTKLYLPHSLPISENRCISFSTKERDIPLLFNPGRQWAVLIGYKTRAAFDLADALPILSDLVCSAKGLGFVWEPDISINHSLRALWEKIGTSKYRAFRGKAELLLNIYRLAEEYGWQLRCQADQNERTKLALYHKALAYINENVLDSINKEKVAEGLGVSTRTLNRAFEDPRTLKTSYVVLAIPTPRNMVRSPEWDSHT